MAIYLLSRLFGQRFVFLNNERLVKKAFADEENRALFQERPKTIFSEDLVKHGVIWSHDMGLQQAMRKILQRALGLYGDGTDKFESVISNGVDAMCQRIKYENGSDFCMDTFIKDSLSNLISILMSGERLEYGSDEINIFWDYTESAGTVAHPLNVIVLSAFPLLRKMPGYWGNIYKESCRCRDRIIDKFYLSKKSTHVSGDARGMVDVFIDIQEKQRAQGVTWFTDVHIQELLVDTVAAALITTHHTMGAFFLALLHHPEVQQKVYKEIGEVVGLSRRPRLEDRSSMPYMQATILEILRCLSTVPLALPHLASQDAILEGYLVEKNSVVFPCLWSIHYNEKTYVNPEEFRPERFLDDNGGLIDLEDQKRQSLMPFGIGRRNCVGEQFARARLFLYFTTLLQQFEFLPPQNSSVPEWNPRAFEHRITIVPPPVYCQVKQRSL
ncbi:hypothetical protein ScPMuIL_015364 [Solemya velum]